MLKELVFESERLISNRLHESDASTLFEFYSDQEVMKFRGSKPMKQVSEALAMIQEQYSQSKDSSTLRIAIRTKSNNQLVGTLLLIHEYAHEHLCEVGFSFGKSHWSQGYAQESLHMILDGLGKQSSIQQVKAWCIKENKASIRVFEKAGFEPRSQNQYPLSILFLKDL